MERLAEFLFRFLPEPTPIGIEKEAGRMSQLRKRPSPLNYLKLKQDNKTDSCSGKTALEKENNDSNKSMLHSRTCCLYYFPSMVSMSNAQNSHDINSLENRTL